MMARALALSALCAVLFGAGACRKVDPRRRSIEDALGRYNRALSEAYLVGRTDPLLSVASEDETERVEVLIASLRSANRQLLATVERLEVTSIEAAPDGAAIAETRERWSYERVSQGGGAADGGATRGPTRRDFRMRYFLEPKGASWIVDRSEFVEPSREVAR